MEKTVRSFVIFLQLAESIFPQTIDFFKNILYNIDDRKNYKSDFWQNYRDACVIR